MIELSDLAERVARIEEREATLRSDLEKSDARNDGRYEAMNANVEGLARSVTKHGVYLGIGTAIGAASISVILSRIADYITG